MSSRPERFHELLWPHRATVLRVAQILAGNRADAEDLAQETLLKAFRALDSFADGTDARAWLLTILRHTRIDRLRAAASAGKHLSLDDLGPEPAAMAGEEQRPWSKMENPEEILQGFSDQQVIAALQALPEEIRWTLLLVDVEGLDHKEAAEVLDVPVGTIKSRAHRGRGMLREALLPVAREMRLTRE